MSLNLSRAEDYPWNITIAIGGVSFTGPGAESRREAEALKRIVEDGGSMQKVEVVKQ